VPARLAIRSLVCAGFGPDLAAAFSGRRPAAG
jgi:hypothetical protein